MKERHVTDQLYNYFKKTNKLHEAQSGFGKKHLCRKALVKLNKSWMKDSNSVNIIGFIFWTSKVHLNL